MKDYFEKLEEWEDLFQCSNCGNLNHQDFIYQRTVANGEVWDCKYCKSEILVDEEPKPYE